MTLSAENLVGYVRAEFAKASNLRVWLFFVQLAVAVPGAASVVVDDKLILYVLAIAGAVLAVAWWVLNIRSEGDTDKAPSHRLFAGKTEIGAAWAKTSKEGRPYLSAKIDDPSFHAPVYATLIEDSEAAGAFSLIWSRRAAE